MPAANTSASSVAKQFHQVLLVTTLIAIASLNSWASVTVSPASETFAKTFVGVTSSAKAVTITNTGASAQVVKVVTSADFSETDNCSPSVAAGKSCVANISFTPTLVGSISGAAGIYDNSNNLLAFVGLTGSSAASVSVSPTSISFTGGTVGAQSAMKIFNITNNTTSNSVNVTGVTTKVTDYQIDTGTCLTDPLAAGASCTVTVQVTPTSATDNGAIIVTNDLPGAAPLVVKLTSAATGMTNPISLTPATLTFTTASGGTSAAQTVTVKNTSTSSVALGQIAPSSDYIISSDSCSSATLAVKNSTCTFKVQFQPAFVGGISGSIAVPWGDGSDINTPLVVNLTGTSWAPLTIAPAKLTFASQAIGTTSAAQAVTITNNSASPAPLNVIATPDFQIQASGTTCPLTGGSLAATSNCVVQVQFAPTVGGSILGAINVNGSSANPLMVQLAGSASGFTLTAAPSTLSIAQGASKTSTITVHPTNGFSGSVNLAVTSTLPNGVTASFSQNPTTTTSVLTLTASSTATAGGPIAVAVTGTSGALTQTATINLTVTATKNFTLSAAPSTLNIIQGGNGTSTITVNPISGFTGSVALSVVSTLPNGVTASFSPASAKTTSTLTLTASASATTGPATVTVQGTSGALTQTTNISLTVNPPQSFTLSAAPNTLSVAQGSSNTSTITVTDVGGFSGSVTLAASGLPSGVTAGFATNPTTGTSLLTLTASALATTGGPTTVTITGTSGALTETTTIALTVTAAPNFTLSAAPNTLSVAQGGSNTSTITVHPTNGFTGSVTLAASGLPSGVTAGFATNPTTGTSVLTLTASTSATVGGPTTVTITGTSGSLTAETTTISLTVTPQPNFTLSASPNTLSVGQGSSNTSTITVNPNNGFTGGVTLAASGLPSGVTAGFATNPTTGTSVLTLTASASATTGGPTTVTITGTSGGLTHTTSISLTVTPPPNFTLSASPSTLSVAQGSSNTSTITVNPTNGFTGSVTLAASGLPSGVTAGFATNPTTGTSLLTLTASASATIGGPVTVTITGTSGALTQTTTISLTVTPQPNFTLSASPNTLSIAQGSNGTSTITVNPTNGFTGSVTLAASGLPSGVTAGFATNPTTGTSVLTLTASALAITGGPTTVTITGTSGALTPQTTTISLTVTAAPNFTLSASPNTLSIVQGSNGTSTITVTPTNGFTGSVTLAASGLPSGVTAGFATNPTTGTSVLTLTASGTATTGGPTTVTITGTSGALTPETTTISLTVTPQPNFTLSASPNTLSIVQGSNGTSTITVNPTNRFTGSVTLAASGLPSGVTAGFATNPTTGTSVLTLTASASATTGGPTTVTITGTSSALTQTTTISLTVTGAPNFTLSAAPSTLSVAQGSSNTSTITVNPTNGFTGSVTLAASGLPSGVTATFGTNPTTGSSLLTLTASASAATGGPTTVTITGTSGSLTQTTTLSLTVTAAGASIVVNPTSAHRGASQTIVITGTGTTFGSTTKITFSTAIGQGTITVNGPTSLSVPITVGPNATLGAGTVTVTTGSQVVTATFTVLAGVPAITAITPSNIASTQQNLSVTVTGVFTNWTSATTTANFGAGIKVGSGAAGAFGNVTVTNATTLTATLTTSGAAVGYRTVQIQTTGSPAQVLTVTNGMLVENCGSTAPSVVQMTPANNSTAALLNAPIRVQFSGPMMVTNSGNNSPMFTLGSTGSVFFYDANTFLEVPATLTLDPSNTIMTITPKTALTAGDEYFLYLSWQSALKDACGSSLNTQGFTFNTAFSVDATLPNLIATSPVNGDTNIPISGTSSPTPVVLQFDSPIDPITAQIGFSMLSGANAVQGNFTYSVDDKTVTFTPTSALTANTTYTVTYGTQITDAGGNPLNNPGSFSFTTGTVSDTTPPSVTQVDPPNGTFGVGLNVTPRLSFSGAVDGATLPGALSLVYADTGVIVPATVTVSANRLTATLTPSSPLLPNTAYNVSLPSSTYTDIAGNPGSGSSTFFYTGTSAYTTPLTVATINPSNGQTGVPLNAHIAAVMSNNVDPTTVTSASITVTPSGGSAIGGTVTLANDGVTLTFTPSAALTASKVYNVSVGGFTDIDGNAVTTFTSSFTTGTTSYGGASFTLVSTSPVNGASSVSVTSPVVFTMSNLINAASVNPNTVYVYATNSSQVVAGNYNVNGAAVTFTPLTPYPANTLMGMCVSGLTDEAGNAAGSQCYGFTTASTPDNTPPTVTITPANGATNVGLNSQVVLIFSKSMNPSTINTNTLTLFNGDSVLNYGLSISRDNRTVVLNPAGNAFTPGATITVALSSGIHDLSGNALANTSSQFTLTTSLSNNAPSVLEMRPGNGATEVPANTVVTLFTSGAMNPSTIAGALYVADNGLVITGTLQVSSNGQAIAFTPSVSFGASDVIQVTLDSTALSSSGVPLSSFSGSFTVADSVNTAVANALVVNPLPGATNVPLNTIIQIQYDEPLDSSTLTLSNVTLQNFDSGAYLSPTLSLVGTEVINIAPTSNLTAHTDYQACVTSSVKNTAEKKVAANCYFFTTGATADTAAPTIVSLAPTNGSTNIGTNASVSVNFNKAINPVSVTGSTIQLSANSIALPTSVSFPVNSGGNPDYTRVSITPQAPLPPSAQIKVVISGVTSEAGKSVATTTIFFTTQAQPDYNAPYVINSSVQNGQTNVPVNSVFAMQFNKAMDLGSVDVATFGIGIDCYGDGIIPATVSWSADQTTISIVPTSALAVGSQYFLYSASLADLAGNPQQTFCNSFTTSFSANTNPPTVVNTSPENTETLVPVNAPIQILFSEPINPASVGLITLQTAGNAVSVTPTLTDASQLLTLTPALTLLPNASYTLKITGVKDTAGNQMAGTVTNTFTTGPTFDLLTPSVTLTDPPAGATGVGTNVAPRIVFNERLNPLSVVSSSNELYYQGSVELYNNASGQYVPATVSMSADRLTAIITPGSALQPNTSYQIIVNSGAYYDVAGNAGTSYSSGFVTASGSDTVPAAVNTISPANSQTGVPLNAQIIAVMTDQIDPTTVTNASITVTPSGGSAIAGTVTLANDGVTVTFTPSAALTASTLYNVSVGGFNDVESNSVTSFTSSFTTGASSYGSGSFTLLSTSPANAATNVSVTSPVTFNMSNLINAASVNPNTVYVYANNTNKVVAGTYNVIGAAVTFTPLTQYPANTLMGMCVSGLTDEAGNAAGSQCYSFTTGTPADTTPPTVTITPADGTINAGLNTQVVLTFSKSINPATINASSVNVLNGDVPLNLPISISRDNSTVVLNYASATLPAGATLTVTATHLITDLSGNALADTTSQFTTTPAVLNTAPTVTNMRPGIGATNVALNTVITLFTSAPMNSGSLSGALHISQNGTLVSGTTTLGSTVGSYAQSIEFTPSSSLAPGATVQVVLDSTAQDMYGNYLSSFSASFTTAGSLANTNAAVQAVNPSPSAANVPLNTVIQIEYNQQMSSSSVAYPQVALYDSTNTSVPSTVSLTGNGQVINIAPNSNLVAGSAYSVQILFVQNIDGVTVQRFNMIFTTGAATDTVAPNILTVAPPDSSTNIGTNAGVSVNFDKAVNPVSVNGSSIQLSGGSITEVPSSISFTPDYLRTIIVPQAPLPGSTQMAIAISGVTSVAGTPVASQTTSFTTMAGADFTAPYVVNSSVQSGQTVGNNAAFAMQFNKPLDQGSVDGAVVGISSTACYLAPVQASLSWSADQTTIFLAPTNPLANATTYYLYSENLMDLSGNSQQTNFCVTFSTGIGGDTTGPVVQQVSPPSGFTGVPINAPVQILFNEPISGASLGGVTLQQGSSVIPTIASLYDGNRGIQLLPTVPLATGTVYTINVTGVVDITGNAQSSVPSQSFTTGTGTNLVAPTVVSTSPTSGQTSVPVTTAVQIVFSEAMDPASFDPSNNSFTLKDASNNVVPATITFSPDYKTATLQPNSNLTGGGVTYTMYVGFNNTTPLEDLAGNPGGSTLFSFKTQ